MKLPKKNNNWTINSISKKKVSFCEKVIVNYYVTEKNEIKIDAITKNIIDNIIDTLRQDSDNPEDHEDLIVLKHQGPFSNNLTEEKDDEFIETTQCCCFQQ